MSVIHSPVWNARGSAQSPRSAMEGASDQPQAAGCRSSPGSSGLPRNTPHTVDAVSGLPENTHRDNGGLPGSAGTCPELVTVSRGCPRACPLTAVGSASSPGVCPTLTTACPGYPKARPAPSASSRASQKETAAKAGGFPLLPGNAPGNAGAFLGRRNKEGNMGAGRFLGGSALGLTGRYYFPHKQLRYLSGEVRKNLQEMSRFTDRPFFCFLSPKRCRGAKLFPGDSGRINRNGF